ncbi:hypothetical protein GQ42DRAFT_159962 [Ramicandelaber brevisporus]|nr:hypothetical protein GQ42DRAFT_159962 [Ramicandelaber brevisporus]
MSQNWRNINNWHWVDKSCLPWARSYFERELVGTSTTSADGKIAAEISSLTSVEGDVDLNMRKGKIISIFDVVIKLNWKGTFTKEAAGESEDEASDVVTASGTINIPEVAHDTDPSDYVFEVTMFGSENASRETAAIKELVRTQLGKALTPKLIKFSGDLIAEHTSGLLGGSPAPGSTNGSAPGTPGVTIMKSATQIGSSRSATPVSQVGASVPAAVAESLAKKSATSSPAPSASADINTVTVKQDIEFVASAQDLYLALADKARMSAWTRSPVIFDAQPGAPFSLFNGNIQGTVVSAEPGSRLKLKWRSSSWPAGHHSDVDIHLVQSRESVILKLVQDGVPVGLEEITERNWHQFFWGPIKSTFGYGATTF